MDRLSGMRETLLPADPGRRRLWQAARIVVTGGVAWVLLRPIPPGALPVGLAAALYLAAFAGEAAWRARAMTVLAAVPAGLAGAVLAILLAPSPAASVAATVVLIVLGLYASERDRRWPVLGQMALGGLVLGLVARIGAGDLPHWGLALLAAAAANLLCGAVTLRGRPESGLRNDIQCVIACIDAAVKRGGWSAAQRRALLRRVARLQGRAGPVLRSGAAPEHAARLFALELMTERTARRALGQLTEGAGPGAPLAVSLDNLTTLLRLPAEPVPEPWPAAASAKGSPAFPSPGLRHGTQAACAALLAVAGWRLAPHGAWAWPVLVAYLLFLGTRSRADTRSRGLRTVAGTGVGVAGGLLLSAGLSGEPAAARLGMVLAAGLAALAGGGPFPVAAFWLTAAAASLFGLLGGLSLQPLGPPLLQTAVGALAGIAAAWLFRGARTAVVARRAGREMLGALTKLVRSAAATAAGGRRDPTLPGLALSLQGRLYDVRSAARPRLFGVAGLADPALRRQVDVLGFCAEWGNRLARSVLIRPAPPEASLWSEEIRAAAERIATQAALLSQTLDPTPGLDARAPIPSPRIAAQPAIPGLFAEPAEPDVRQLRLLLLIDMALQHELRRALRHP